MVKPLQLNLVMNDFDDSRMEISFALKIRNIVVGQNYLEIIQIQQDLCLGMLLTLINAFEQYTEG